MSRFTGRDNRAGQRAGRPSRGDETEQPLALLRRKQVGHERPEHRHCEQVEDADPDEENARDMQLADVQREQHPEDRDVGDEEVVHEWNEPPARQAGHDGAEQRDRGEHHREGGGEQPLKIAHAARDAHLVAQRPQHVIAGEQAEEIGERPAERVQLARPHRDDPCQPPVKNGVVHMLFKIGPRTGDYCLLYMLITPGHWWRLTAGGDNARYLTPGERK
jgi:hypothetical protein